MVGRLRLMLGIGIDNEGKLGSAIPGREGRLGKLGSSMVGKLKLMLGIGMLIEGSGGNFGRSGRLGKLGNSMVGRLSEMLMLGNVMLGSGGILHLLMSSSPSATTVRGSSAPWAACLAQRQYHACAC